MQSPEEYILLPPENLRLATLELNVRGPVSNLVFRKGRQDTSEKQSTSLEAQFPASERAVKRRRVNRVSPPPCGTVSPADFTGVLNSASTTDQTTRTVVLDSTLTSSPLLLTNDATQKPDNSIDPHVSIQRGGDTIMELFANERERLENVYRIQLHHLGNDIRSLQLKLETERAEREAERQAWCMEKKELEDARMYAEGETKEVEMMLEAVQDEKNVDEKEWDAERSGLKKRILDIGLAQEADEAKFIQEKVALKAQGTDLQRLLDEVLQRTAGTTEEEKAEWLALKKHAVDEALAEERKRVASEEKEKLRQFKAAQDKLRSEIKNLKTSLETSEKTQDLERCLLEAEIKFVGLATTGANGAHVQDHKPDCCPSILEVAAMRKRIQALEVERTTATAAATSWAAERMTLVQMLEGLQRKSCQQLETTTNKANRDSSNVENPGSRACTSTSDGERPTVADLESRLAHEQAKQAILEDQALQLLVLIKTIDSAAQQQILSLEVNLQRLRKTHQNTLISVFKMFKAQLASDETKFEDEKMRLTASEHAKYAGEKTAMEAEHQLAVKRLQKLLEDEKATAKNLLDCARKTELGLRKKIAETTQAFVEAEHQAAIERLQKLLEDEKATAKSLLDSACKTELGLRKRIAEITQANTD